MSTPNRTYVFLTADVVNPAADGRRGDSFPHQATWPKGALLVRTERIDTLYHATAGQEAVETRVVHHTCPGMVGCTTHRQSLLLDAVSTLIDLDDLTPANAAKVIHSMACYRAEVYLEFAIKLGLKPSTLLDALEADA